MADAKINKVAIVGTAPTSNMLAPFTDASWEIWACSAGNMGRLPRVNIWFEMHAMAEMQAAENREGFAPYFKWLNEQAAANAFQIVGLEFTPHMPKAVPYPRDEMVELFGRNWFTSSIAYMMALAIARGASEIALFGVDMAAGQEHYEAQRAGCTRFIEIAEERGIKVHVPMESCLKTAAPMYGYWEGTPFGRRLNAVALQVRGNLNNLQAQQRQLELQAQYFAGAMEQIEYFKRTWTDGAEMPLDLGNLEARRLAAKVPAAVPALKTVEQLLSGDVALAAAPVPAMGPQMHEAAADGATAGIVAGQPATRAQIGTAPPGEPDMLAAAE